MRTFIIILCIVVAAVAAIAVYLAVTTPEDAPPLRFPLTPAQQNLLAHVPAEAEAYGLVPAPAVLLGRLVANPITREPVTQWKEEHPLPPAAMLGRADAVIWRTGKTTSYAVRFDPVRALIARAWTLFSPVDAHWVGRTLVINGGDGPEGSAPPPELSGTAGLPDGDAFVVQRSNSRGAFPPMGRPALTSIAITSSNIDITSRAVDDGNGGSQKPALAQDLPRSAMLSVAFTEPPRILSDLDRLIAADIDALVNGGGTIAVYRVDTGTFLPRPDAAIVVPATDASRAVLARYGTVLDSLGQAAEHEGQLVVAFDRRSAGLYMKDDRTPVPWPANRWVLRLDPVRLIPVLRKLGDNPALRFATPRLHRGARDLRRWVGPFQHARSIEAAASVTGGFEELRVRIAAK
jgi:hypothetical protein